MKILDVEFNKIADIPEVVRRFPEELVIYTQGSRLHVLFVHLFLGNALSASIMRINGNGSTEEK